MFGEDLDQYFQNGQAQIPPVLDLLYDHLKSNNYFTTPQIFLQKTSEDELLSAREKLNRNFTIDSKDPHAAAILIIVRFLPSLLSFLFSPFPLLFLCGYFSPHQILSFLCFTLSRCFCFHFPFLLSFASPPPLLPILHSFVFPR